MWSTMAIKRDEGLTHVMTWMNLENTMLNEKKKKTSDKRPPTLYDFTYMKCPGQATQ